MKYLLILFMLVACASTKPITPVNPPPPIVTPPKPEDTVVKHDTVTRTIVQQVASGIISSAVDSNSVYLTPSGGDDQPAIQALVYAHKHVRLSAGLFKFYHPVLVYTWGTTDYDQSWCWITGVAPAQNTAGPVTIIQMEDPRYPAFIVQRGKNFIFENLQGQGLYKAPQTQLAISTYTRAQWRTNTSDAPTHPHGFIVVDGFTDPADFGGDTTKMYPGYVNYYIPGMSKSGSTGGQILNCNITGWNVGIVFTLGGTLNAECNTVDHCYFGNDMSAIASTQAQAKTNWVRDCMAWGGIHTIIDGVYYGLAHGDAATPVEVDGMNIAGPNFQYCNVDTRAFPFFSHRVDAESLTIIGSTGNQTSAGTEVVFEDCRFEFVNGGYSPYNWYHGAGTEFRSCIIRFYNGGTFAQQRIVLNDNLNRITGGSFGAPPLMAYGANGIIHGTIEGVSYEYFHTPIPQNYDSVCGPKSVLLRVQGTNGYYLTPDTAGLVMGTLIVTQAFEPIDTCSLYHALSPLYNFQTPVGYVDHRPISDTVWVDNIGIGMKDSTLIPIYKALYKKQ
jgi:hypothetical protein